MKSYFDNKPNSTLALGNGMFHIYWNIQEFVNEEHSGWEADYLEVGSLEYCEIINALIRRGYSVSDELAINRQRDVKTTEFQEYFNYCEECKVIAKGILE